MSYLVSKQYFYVLLFSIFENLNKQQQLRNTPNMSFIRKKSLNKKPSQQLQPNISTLNTSSLSQSSDLNSSQKSHSPYNPNQVLQSIRKLVIQFGNTPKQSWERSVSETLSIVLQLKKGVLISQKLNLYKQCIVLMSKYQQQLKKTGAQLNQKTAFSSLSAFKGIVEQTNKITQDQRNDQMVMQNDINKPIFDFLEAIALTSESQFTNQQKRPSLMRKNSLKKVQQLPAVRPSSRGKLATLSKKDSLPTSKKEILDIRPSSKNEQRQARSLLEDLILGICSILKNLSANAKLRKDILKQDYLRIINRYLGFWNEKNNNTYGTQLMVQLTACYRHLAVEEKSHKLFLKSNCFETWTRLIEMFPTSNDVVFNLLRIISKLSNYESVCLKLNEKKQCIKTLSSFFKFYKNHIHIIIRVAFIFANMTSYLSDIRNQLYFDFNAWTDIFVCFDHYATSQLSGKNQVQKMGLSMAAWDYQAIKKQSDIEAIIKIIRLIANIFTVSQIGQDIYMNDAQSYRELVKKLKGLLQKKSNIEKSSELIACILSCLTNVLFYDRESLMSNPQYRTIKCQLTNILVDFIVQIDNEEICCEALRVVSNITRMKQFIKVVLQAKIHEAILILLESTCKQIVYYSLGILINLMIEDQFKEQYKEFVLSGVIDILNECDSEDFDLVGVGLKALACLLDAGNENIDPDTLSKVENCLMNLGSHCDKAMISKDENTELTAVQQSRSLINLLLNSMPEDKFICPVKNCGRKFGDDAKLAEHVKRRHKLS